MVLNDVLKLASYPVLKFLSVVLTIVFVVSFSSFWVVLVYITALKFKAGVKVKYFKSVMFVEIGKLCLKPYFKLSPTLPLNIEVSAPDKVLRASSK